MIDFESEAVFDKRREEYRRNARKQFPEAELLIAIKTSPTSVMTISAYPDEEVDEWALEMRDQRMDTEEDLSGWHMEGEISFFP